MEKPFYSNCLAYNNETAQVSKKFTTSFYSQSTPKTIKILILEAFRNVYGIFFSRRRDDHGQRNVPELDDWQEV
jgi:hypothetical protein